jgi:putative transcriptional regulator
MTTQKSTPSTDGGKGRTGSKPSSANSANNTGPPLHNRLAVLRAERQLSRQELADAVGVNFQTIGYIERGDYHPSLDLAFRLSEFFELPIEAIFSREPFIPLSQALYHKDSHKDGSK